MKKPRLLVSACLLGQPVRYDGQAKAMAPSDWEALRQRFEIVPACPECLGGLPTPRPPAEIRHGDGTAVLQGLASVQTRQGQDVSQAFVNGARRALEIARRQGCQAALLKANSPSCGNLQIYDGSFAAVLSDGQGVAASLLEQHGIRVWNETQMGDLLAWQAGGSLSAP
ncbi:DUF523 domain-containing protein [Chromobacterium subtsugae]|uniref:DUF523 domain-containing protein n=1 Tax=Chromobacterium subtsugae TaxID=251747 RepID=A0ABS7FFV2_9NEIS|nr:MULTISPECIES: DUF523 domain-containing protein [Chromobacterium]KUM04622.1 hypothetical protein Cv017_13600 [Chromobacterium subtsugae]KZE84800.1 hypothetical protein AWB61_21545 [Chromobacterium sp. F49]MBW7567634.1 DUF523 domain-containing protein [Chromobacterium subtsugae]MBW8288866.1 DUF523 domain-containing protein [Chromobacterium subtsugae]WSE91341.1 DUF523 domain-containing protein [Chromobacterium subtsugae]